MSSAARPALEFEELAANPSDAEEAVAWALECVLTPRGFAYAVHSREGHSMVAYENCPPGACPSGRELPRAPWVSRRTSRWWGNVMEHAVRNSARVACKSTQLLSLDIVLYNATCWRDTGTALAAALKYNGTLNTLDVGADGRLRIVAAVTLTGIGDAGVASWRTTGGKMERAFAR